MELEFRGQLDRLDINWTSTFMSLSCFFSICTETNFSHLKMTVIGKWYRFVLAQVKLVIM